MSEPMISIDERGWPVIRKPAAVALADPVAPAGAPIELRGRRLLDLRQVAQVLAVDLDTATTVVAKASVARVVGWDSAAIVQLATALREDAGLRRELGVERLP